MITNIADLLPRELPYGTPAHYAYVKDLLYEGGPKVWAHNEATYVAIAERVRAAVGDEWDERRTVSVIRAVQDAVRKRFGAKWFWLMGTEHWWWEMGEQVIRFQLWEDVDEMIQAAIESAT